MSTTQFSILNPNKSVVNVAGGSFSANNLLMMNQSAASSTRKRDNKFQEHSWSIVSGTGESYMNQSLIDGSNGDEGGLINTKWDIKSLIMSF